MLDKYINSQPLAYKILKNSLKNGKYAHAYIFEDKMLKNAYELALDFTKELLINGENEQTKKNIISMIESGNHPEVKVISSDTLWIKKEQIKNLQEEFNKKPIMGNKKVYIIEEAEKLNKSSANTILKFLEEPEEGIIAILTTKNVHLILETIKSRCQLVKLLDEKSNNGIEKLIKIYNLDEEKLNINIKNIIDFVHFYEKKGTETICYMQKLWHNFFNNKEDVLLGFDLLILYYKDVLNFKFDRETINFDDKEMKEIFKYKDKMEIAQKIRVITKAKEKIKMNANLNLLMDKLIIDLEGEL